MYNPFIAAYYFPDYHFDQRNRITHGEGWTEWELTRKATARFPGHRQPRVPLWGYLDEADPEVMRKKIDTAAEYGVDCFIFDWYFYNDGLFLQRPLEEAFMPVAQYDRRVKFALMWANHDWIDLHPWRSGTPKNILYPGLLDDDGFARMTDYVIEKYFTHPAYWKIDGKPYFSIYDLSRLGGKGMERIQIFRDKVKAAGFPGIHLNLIVAKTSILPGEGGKLSLLEQGELFDSLTNYIWIHMPVLEDFPRSSEELAHQRYMSCCRELIRQSKRPFFPNVTMGWDASPRTAQDTPYELEPGYPYVRILDFTPEQFAAALAAVGEFRSPVITVNAWNEWTESSYLEPDTQHGYGYLEAIRDYKRKMCSGN